MKILHLEHTKYPAGAISKLQAAHNITNADCNSQEELYAMLSASQYEAIFTRLGVMIDSQAINLQPKLKYIITSTTGLNHIDTDACEERNVRVVSLKGEAEFLAAVKSTAEHTWSLLLALIRNIPAAHASVTDGHWDRIPFLADELDTKTLGIIGYGRLGKIVARYGVAFGMNVLAYDHDATKITDQADVSAVNLDTLLAESDFVVLLISFSKENEKFMDAAKFNKMKHGAYFINTSRGEMVDENALLKALQSKKIKGAALDVLNDDSGWCGEVQGSNELLNYARQHQNLLLTPHMGGYGKDSIARTREFVTNKFLTLVSNETNTNS